MKNKLLFFILIILMIFSMLLNACTPEINEAVFEEDAGAGVQSVSEIESEISEEINSLLEESAENGPEIFVWGETMEPDTLDPHKTAAGASYLVMKLLGSTLVYLDQDGIYQPYLAESWEVSEDGLTYTFRLRQDVLFHDGTPLTAADLAFTYRRAITPETASPLTASMLGPVVSIKAVDDYTLVFTLATPYFPFLYGLSVGGYMMPLSQAYVEKNGENFLGRYPMSVGPYKFIEWKTGESILLEKNPDFNWGPESWGNTGPWAIDQIQILYIPDESTIVAGLEAGEIDFAAIEARDLTLFSELEFEVINSPLLGLCPYITLQTSTEPLNDLNVRKALNLAVNHQAALQLLEQGKGVVQYGPLSSSQIGYWAGIEDHGYKYDPEEAKELLEDAGYRLNEDDVYEKDGLPLSFDIYTLPVERWAKTAEVIQSMFAEIGVKTTIRQEEEGALIPRVLRGDYQIAVFCVSAAEADILYQMFHSSQIGGFNYAHVNDPELDEILERSRTETELQARQQALNEAQLEVVKKAYSLPIYTPLRLYVINPQVNGYSYDPYNDLILANARFE